jgi:hypothetical protein
MYHYFDYPGWTFDEERIPDRKSKKKYFILNPRLSAEYTFV